MAVGHCSTCGAVCVHCARQAAPRMCTDPECSDWRIPHAAHDDERATQDADGYPGGGAT